MASSLSALAHSRARCALNGCVQWLRFSQWSNAAGDAAAAMANGTSVLLVPAIVADIANARCAAAPPAALPCTMALLTCIGSLRCRLAARLQALPFERARSRPPPSILLFLRHSRRRRAESAPRLQQWLAQEVSRCRCLFVMCVAGRRSEPNASETPTSERVRHVLLPRHACVPVHACTV